MLCKPCPIYLLILTRCSTMSTTANYHIKGFNVIVCELQVELHSKRGVSVCIWLFLCIGWPHFKHLESSYLTDNAYIFTSYFFTVRLFILDLWTPASWIYVALLFISLNCRSIRQMGQDIVKLCMSVFFAKRPDTVLQGSGSDSWINPLPITNHLPLNLLRKVGRRGWEMTKAGMITAADGVAVNEPCFYHQKEWLSQKKKCICLCLLQSLQVFLLETKPSICEKENSTTSSGVECLCLSKSAVLWWTSYRERQFSER